jgi:hypothetical protein
MQRRRAIDAFLDTDPSGDTDEDREDWIAYMFFVFNCIVSRCPDAEERADCRAALKHPLFAGRWRKAAQIYRQHYENAILLTPGPRRPRQ